MRIETIKAYRVLQPFVDGPYNMSKGRRADAFDAVIVAITSDDGLTGWGEMAPLGNFYSPAFAAGARAGVAEIAPHLLGQDPRALSQISRLMDTVFKGHPYIKSALDMACWDLAARAADIPLVTFLGGRDSDTAELYKVVTHGPVEAMAANAARIVGEGFGRLQVKVGGNVRDDIDRVHAVASAVPKGTVIFCDANAGWTHVPGAAVRRCDTRPRLHVRAALHLARRKRRRAPLHWTSRWCSMNSWRRWRTCWRSTGVGWPTG